MITDKGRGKVITDKERGKVITDKERARMAADMDSWARTYEDTARKIGDRSCEVFKDSKSMAENYRALARALREGKPFEAVA